MNYRQRGVLLSFGYAFSVHAIQPCPQTSECVDERSVKVIAWFEELVAACSLEIPEERKRYEAGLNAGLTYMLQQQKVTDITDFVDSARMHPIYLETKIESRSIIEKASKAGLWQMCNSFLHKQPEQ